MEININGNPGSGNRYDDVKIQQVGSYNPNAKEVHIHQQVGGQNSRMASWFRKLKEEIDHDDKLQKKMADIKQAVSEQVIIPVMKELNENGEDDIYLCYTTDDILGMLYYLTGNCHINWANYDV
jgi:hypothetical protein